MSYASGSCSGGLLDAMGVLYHVCAIKYSLWEGEQ